jgi:cyclase
MREIAKGVYVEDAYFSGNVACVCTGEGAVLIDSPMLPRDAWAWLKKVDSVTKQGIAFLISTDYRIERVLGNCFVPTTSTIAHQAAWAEMQRYDEGFLQRYFGRRKQYHPGMEVELAKARVVLPELTLTTDLTLYKGDQVLRLIHAGGHTSASIMVHLPKERFLFSGNVVVSGEHPSLNQANTLKWLHALEMIRDMEDVDIIVPGHGDLCDPSATEMLTDYITQMRERVYEHYSAGLTRRETVDKVRMQDFFEVPPDRRAEIERRIRGSVERVYDEFKKGKLKKRR